MLLKILKTGRFACADPSKPHLNLTELEHKDIDDATAAELIRHGWAEVPKKGDVIEPDSVPEQVQLKIKPEPEKEKPKAKTKKKNS